MASRVADESSKLNRRDFKQFLRDLRDLAQAAERRISARRRGLRMATVEGDQLHDLATVAAYLVNAKNLDPQQLETALRQRDPGLTPADLKTIGRYVKQYYGKRAPNLDVQQNAQAYRDKQQMGSARKLPYVAIDPEIATQIAAEFHNLPHTLPDPKTPEGRKSKTAYDAFKKEIADQFAHLPVTVEKWDKPGQPYANSREFIEDIHDNNHLWVFYGGEDHPYLTRDEIFQFRAVHDYYGHAGNGFELGPRGEENAWMAHSQMFSPEARPAMTSETRGANSWVNSGPYGKHNRAHPDKTIFAPQKAHVLPDHYNTREVPDFRFASRRQRVARLIRV